MADAQFIADGIAESLWTAREFQYAANRLYEAGQLAPAYILVTSALEHLGRAIWLLENRGESEAELVGGIRLEHSKGVETGLRVSHFDELLSVEDEPAGFLQKVRDHPKQIHLLRMRAQYVEYDVKNRVWNSPRQATKRDCHQQLMDLADSYGFLQLEVQAVPDVCERIKREMRETIFRKGGSPSISSGGSG